jgi:hypothetical protein
VPGTVGDPNLFISSSLDGSVKVWSLDVTINKTFYLFIIEILNVLPILASIYLDL